MRRLTIERMEGVYAICVDAEQKRFAIELTELPQGAAVGAVLEISDAGTLSIAAEKPADRRRK